MQVLLCRLLLALTALLLGGLLLPLTALLLGGLLLTLSTLLLRLLSLTAFLLAALALLLGSGLGAIANPGLDSIRAVIYPQESPYLYFRAACDGSGHHNFATTFEEHVSNGCP